MAEPARKFEDEEPELSAREKADQAWGMADKTEPTEAGVGYKTPLEEASSRWGNASVISGDGDYEDSDDTLGQKELGDAEGSTKPISTIDPNSDSTSQNLDDIKNNELEAEPSDIDKDLNYNPSKKSGLKRGLKGLASKRAKIALAGIIVSVVMSVLAFIGLLPLKLVHMAENLQDRFFSMGQSAVEERGERIMSRYLRKHVLPSLGKDCPSTKVSRSCVAAIPGDTPAARMFRGWKDARLENTLAEKYGIEFYKDADGPKMRTTTIPKGVDISDFANGEVGDNLFESKNLKGRAEIRRAFNASFEDESKLKKIWLRIKVGSLLGRKYAVKRCVFACKIRDNFADWKDTKKTAFRRMVAHRIIKNTDKTYAYVVACVISANCDKRENSDGKISDTKIEGEVNDVLEKRLSELDVEDVAKIIDYSNEIIKKGFLQFAIEQIIKTVFTSTVIQEGALSAVPLVGQVIFAIKILDAIQNSPKVIAAARFAILASTMVPFFYLLLSHAGEIKSGRVDPDIVEGAMETFQPSESDLQGAEVSPLFNTIMGGESPAVSFFNGTVHAASNNSDIATGQIMKCADGKEIKPGKLVCEEDTLGVNSELLAGITAFFSFLGPIGDIIHAANTFINWVQSIVNRFTDAIMGWITANVPILQTAIGYFSSKLGDALKYLLTTFLHFPDLDSMSGARAFNTASGGATVSGVEAAKNGVGGKPMTEKQVADASQEMHNQDIYEFKQKSFYARMFDTDSPRSLISQTAMVMPGNEYRARDTLMAFVSNPFAVFKTTAVASISNNAVAASNTYGEQTYKGFTAFDMKPVGVSKDDPVMNNDPEDESLYGEEACKAEEERWLSSDNYEIDGADGSIPMTYFAYPKTVNRCRLEKSVTCAMGAVYVEKLTDVCEEGDQSGGDDSNNSTDPSNDPATNPNVDPSEDTSNIPCPAGTEDGGVQQDYGPRRTPGARIRICGIPGAIPKDRGVNSSAAANALAMINAAKADGVTLTGNAFRSYDAQVDLRRQNCGDSFYAIYEMSSGSCDPPTAVPGNSMHEVGLAIDFSSYSFGWLSSNAGRFGFYNLPSERWHWSTTGG